jgi:hypothetical protein
VSHFTIFAVRGLPGTPVQPAALSSGPESTSSPDTETPSSTDVSPAAGGFVYSDLNVTPDTVRAGEKVTVSMLVVNAGLSRSSGNVELKVNGEDQEGQKLTLEQGKSQPVKFTVSGKSAGNYTVSVGGLSGGFRVSGDSGFDPGSDWSSIAIVIVVCLAGLGIAIVLLRDIFRKRD